MWISRIKEDARTSLQGYSVSSGFFVFVFFLISALPPTVIDSSLSGGFENWINQTDSPPLSDIFQLIYFIITIPMQFGFYWYFLDLIRDQTPKMKILFFGYEHGKMIVKLVWTYVLMAILLCLWILLFIIPGIIKSFSYSQTYFILKDHPDYSASKAIKESKRLMKGHKWKLFLLGLSFIGWWLLSIVPTLGGIIAAGLIGFMINDLIGYLFLAIGIIGSIWMYLWLVPYFCTSLATFYERLILTQQPELNEQN
ncbi:DUF975 family protein [Sporolactobacillus sp. STCC-11]|uniref:DUF975 family protein n=1 Tax=Sporolactobacillus caesalpiniae TaxID=3230362 RepID=UPI003398D26C